MYVDYKFHSFLYKLITDMTNAVNINWKSDNNSSRVRGITDQVLFQLQGAKINYAW